MKKLLSHTRTKDELPAYLAQTILSHAKTLGKNMLFDGILKFLRRTTLWIV